MKCTKCNGKRYVKIVDTQSAYAFKDVPCLRCGCSGVEPMADDTPQGMFVCEKCGKEKFKHHVWGLLCDACDMPKLVAEIEKTKAKGKGK